MRTFQIIQNFGGGTKGFVYFDIKEDATPSEMEAKAISVQKDDHKNRRTGWFGVKAEEKSVLKVKEYCNKKHRALKGGIEFKIKWR